MSARTTIRDVSRAAGVSVATVSNVLNAPGKVSAETKEKVAAAIEELRYRPNRAARSLPQGRTFTIGYCIPDGGERFALDTFLHRLTQRASDSDMGILLFTPHRGQSEADSYREIFRRGAVDGFILSSTVHGDERIQVLLDTRMPLVTFGRTDLAHLHSWVDVEGRAGTRAAVDHLTAQGHRRLALVAWPEGSISGDERAAGFLDGLEAAGIEHDPGYLVRSENSPEAGREAATRLLELEPQPTAIVTVQDVIAAGVLAELKAGGIRGGRDIAVTGFDDSPPAIYSTPSITSVRRPIEAIGRQVVEFLIHNLEDGRHEALRPGRARVGGQGEQHRMGGLMGDTWLLTEDRVWPGQMAWSESLFSIANGHLGTRGSFEEGLEGSVPATFMHGLFHTPPGGLPHLFHLPDWTGCLITVDGVRFRLDEQSAAGFERVLDLHTGILTRRVLWRGPGTGLVRIEFRRLLSLAAPELASLEVTVVSLTDDVQIGIETGLDGSVTSPAGDCWDRVEWERSGFDRITMRAANAEGETAVTAATSVQGLVSPPTTGCAAFSPRAVGAEPESCLVVEDAVSGVAAGRARAKRSGRQGGGDYPFPVGDVGVASRPETPDHRIGGR